MMTRFLATILSLGAAFGLAQENRPRFTAVTSQGDRLTGELVDFRTNFNLTLEGKSPHVISGELLVALRQLGSSLPPNPAVPWLLLSTGDQISLESPLRFRLTDDALTAGLARPLTGADGKETSVPQAALGVLALALPTGVNSSEELLAKLKDRRQNDLLILRNGDRIEGQLKSLDATAGCRIMVAGEMLEFTVERIALLAFNTEVQARPRTKKAYVQALLKGGSRIHFATLSLDNGFWHGTDLLGSHFAFPLDHLIALKMRQGKAVYLDELKPTRYETTPFLDVSWPLAVNRTVLGGPLRLGADTFDRGLGMHSRSQVCYAIDARDHWFEAVVGVDPAAGPRAAVRLRVDLDGKPGDPIDCKASDPPRSLRLDVRGAKSLNLLADFGPQGDVRGHAIWADARLIRD